MGLQGAGGVKNFSVGICDGAPSTARSSFLVFFGGGGGEGGGDSIFTIHIEWIILVAFFALCYFLFSKLTFQQTLSGIPSECQTVKFGFRSGPTLF